MKEKKVKVTLKPGPWELEVNEYGFYVDKTINEPSFPLKSKYIDHIEPLPDYDKWIADKVPVIGYDELDDNAGMDWLIGVLHQAPTDKGFLIHCGRNDKGGFSWYGEIVKCSPQAIEKLQRGQRPE